MKNLIKNLFYLPENVLFVFQIMYFRIKYEERATMIIREVLSIPYDLKELPDVLDRKFIEVGIDHEEYRQGAIGAIVMLKTAEQNLEKLSKAVEKMV